MKRVFAIAAVYCLLLIGVSACEPQSNNTPQPTPYPSNWTYAR